MPAAIRLARTLLLLLPVMLATLAVVAPAADPATGWWPPFVPDVPPPPAAAAGPVAGATETLVLDEYEAAGISGFRKDWDRPIPLRHDGLTTVLDRGNFGKGAIAVWDDPDKPGALACDAVHRSLLVRFPEAAERIAAALAGGKKLLKVELVLPLTGTEIFPPGYMDPAGMSFLGNQWATQQPR